MIIECQKLWKVYGDGGAAFGNEDRSVQERIELAEKAGAYVALADIDIGVERGETLVVMGLSGSGKSTLLRCLTRLIEPTSGEVRYEGRPITNLPRTELLALRRQHMSMVFQNFALLPHRTVLGNVELPLEIQKQDARSRRTAALEMIELVGLKSKEDHYPHELSGGQQQRVGIARSLCSNPSLWLLDEPFSALDPLIRREMQDEVLRLQSSLAKAVIFVTHDFEEAARVGDRIAILRRGRLVQCGTAEELVSNPVDDYVRAFTAEVDRGRVFKVERFMERGEPQAADRLVPMNTSLKDVSRIFAEGANVLAFSDDKHQTVGFMRREKLGEALAAAEFGGPF
ncbi:ATP-binding cassette domain-containing protein [Rhizobium sp. AG855]|uniref:ATP-binding cassette domain-containing protein n=1 Tax=Rhizobium sp. AG855 TaxID=2183898 RepID=UPI000E7589B7|nr:ATP-binding cassette domain-containing protein [Rhizobium sp. AG855]RKE83367.1 glycine betaine/proline transport system ATP-binding protein [Rhizobium sp. AG855]